MEQRDLSVEDNSYNTDQMPLKSSIEKLAAEMARADAIPKPWHPDPIDPFSFTATIMRPYQDNSNHTLARGKLDSGCDDNWISTAIIERAGLSNEVILQPTDDPTTYTAFGGQKFKPLGSIVVSWFAVNLSVSKETNFLVLDDIPSDIVLGKTFILEEGVFMFSKPALALRQSKLSTG